MAALTMACKSGYVQCVELLIGAKNILLDEPETNCRCAIFFASFHGHFEIVQLLLAQSATLEHENEKVDVNRQDIGGYTALFAAAQNGHKSIVQLLLKNKADPMVKCNRSHWTLWVAALRG